ncbi:hypothetical protein ACFL15_01280 [Patescibacteria group bacterium]
MLKENIICLNHVRDCYCKVDGNEKPSEAIEIKKPSEAIEIEKASYENPSFRYICVAEGVEDFTTCSDFEGGEKEPDS